MHTRVLVTSAGSGASGNLMRSLRAGSSVTVVGCHHDQFVLKNSAADRNYLVPPSGQPGWARSLRRIVEAERIDLIIPTSDGDVVALARVRAGLGGRLFLPRSSTVALCRDKHRLTERLRAHRVEAPATYPVTDLRRIERVFDKLGRPARAWCRMRGGAGSAGAIPVASPEQARGWITYWRDMRGVPPTVFTLSEYLPGRDFGGQSLWRDGRPVLIKTYERLSYLRAGSQPSEVSAVGALTKTVCEPRVADVCVRAVRAADRRATGVFAVDVKEDPVGIPRVTEINAGRFTSGTNLLDLTGKYNMSAVYLQLARGDQVNLHEEYEGTEHYYMLRDIDTAPRLFHADEFFEGVEDVRGPRPRGGRAPERSERP